EVPSFHPHGNVLPPPQLEHGNVDVCVRKQDVVRNSRSVFLRPLRWRLFRRFWTALDHPE
ncbi:MAG: hypothetical protein KAJ12_14135, partial [Bacteroidetes bacterium]|nr:hypothetical protein [Bacteroidota bacterium]